MLDGDTFLRPATLLFRWWLFCIFTITVVGDAMARPLADALAAHPGEYDLSSFFALASGGAILSRAVKDAILEHLPNIVVNDAFVPAYRSLSFADALPTAYV